MIRLSISEAREQFSDALNRVSEGERIVLEHNGKDVAALISIEDLELLQLLEDRLDVEAACEALSDGETVRWKLFKREQGL